MLQTFYFQELQAGTGMAKARSAWKLLHIKVGPFLFLLMNVYLILHYYSAMWLICIFIKIHKNTTKQDLCRLSLLFFFAEIRRCLFGAPCSRQIGSFVLYHRNPLHLQRKTGFEKPKILVTVFQMLKRERTGNLYKHAHSLHELCRTCAESKKREAHTSLIQR